MQSVLGRSRYVKLVREAQKLGAHPLSYGANMLASTRRPATVLSGMGSGAKTFFKCGGLSAAAIVTTPFAATYTAASAGWKGLSPSLSLTLSPARARSRSRSD